MDDIKIPVMLSLKEAAQRTGLPRSYIRQLVWDKKICYVRSGRKYLVNLESLCEYLNTPET